MVIFVIKWFVAKFWYDVGITQIVLLFAESTSHIFKPNVCNQAKNARAFFSLHYLVGIVFVAFQ